MATDTLSESHTSDPVPQASTTSNADDDTMMLDADPQTSAQPTTTDEASTNPKEIGAAETAPSLPGTTADTTTSGPLDSISQLIREKQDWVRSMRLQFCRRPEADASAVCVIDENGMLNQDYFRPPKGYKLLLSAENSAPKWTPADRTALIQGIHKHGIGSFREISNEFLPSWSPNELRIKTMRLIGRQNLQLYKGWKGGEEDLARELERNKEIGLRLGCWKSGVLVYDDDGKVLEAILASEKGKEVVGGGAGSAGMVGVVKSDTGSAKRRKMDTE
ncbi:hypothetical protein HK102_014081 [Quaeritorhiza haematococci]|nr:hypothetical protein HK102_014081 [Quaeritorhiza haematococci]